LAFLALSGFPDLGFWECLLTEGFHRE